MLSSIFGEASSHWSAVISMFCVPDMVEWCTETITLHLFIKQQYNLLRVQGSMWLFVLTSCLVWTQETFISSVSIEVYLLLKCTNSGLNCWNSGIVDWIVFCSCFLYLSCCIYVPCSVSTYLTYTYILVSWTMTVSVV